MITTVLTLARWEWFKLQRRWMTWILLLFAVLFAQLSVWGSFAAYRSLQASGGELTVPAALQQGRPRTVACSDLLSGEAARQPADLAPQLVEGLRTQCRQQQAQLPQRLQRSYDSFTLPGSIPGSLGVLQTLGLILMAILTASAIGIDYGAGTLRSVLSKGTGRWQYLAAKLLTLAALAALGLFVAVASVAASGVIAASIAGAATGEPAATAVTWTDAARALGRAWISFLPYVALTAFVTVLARSSAAGMAIGLGYYFAEQLIVLLLSGIFSWFQNVADYLLVRNISSWTGGSGIGPPGSAAVAADTTHALVVLSAYAVVLLTTAFWLFQRRDVHGATGGG